MQKIFRLLMVAAAIVLGAFYFVHWSKTRALNSGEVHVRQQPNDSSKTGTPPTDTASQPAQPQEVASNAGDPSSSGPTQARPQDTVATLPAAETISRNPPNGLVGTGTGKFELYRQGDLTFRLNTETGAACVLFATDTQWSKPLVYEHGCGNH